MTAQEARTMTDSIYIPLDAIFSQIKSQSEAGLSYTYAMINEETSDKLKGLGYIIEKTSQPRESRISW